MKIRYLLALLQLFVLTAAGQEILRPIRLKGGALTSAKNLRNDINLVDQLRKVQYKNKFYTLLQFTQTPNDATRRSLAQEGIVLFDYIPDNTYLAEVTEHVVPAQLSKNIISGVFTLQPETKIADKLKRQLQQPMADPSKLIAVSFYGSIDKATAIAELQQAGALIQETRIQPAHVIFIQATADAVQRIAALPFVAYISTQQLKDQPINNNDRSVHAINALSATAGRNLWGRNVTLGIGDNGEISSHYDFTDRLISRNPMVAQHHALHTAGTMAGAGIVNPRRKGMAPKATIVAQSYSDILVNAPFYVNDFRMVATNNSYHSAEEGCAGMGEYDFLSYYVDAQMNSYPNLLNIFAAGNDGAITCTPFPASFATVKSGFQSGKNVLTVGAIDHVNYNIANFSGRGPVVDGRLKPEIVAGGVSVGSTSLNNGYAPDWGTSMASPVVAGAAGLLTERYRQLHGGADPRAALLKAVLCNTAEDLGNPGPDYTFGYGFLNARKAVETFENNTYFINAISQGGSNTHTITGVPAGTAQLKVLLYWNDPAAAPGASMSLVNNLNLRVTEPGSLVHNPLILNAAALSVNMAATEGIDNLNNIEQVVINSPAAGNYTITVNAPNVPAGPQEYVVVYQVLPPTITLEYPFGEETWVPGEQEFIRWTAPPGNTNNFTVEYTTDNGINWNVINNNIPATSRNLSYFVPATPSNEVRLRVSMNSTAYQDESNYNFTILSAPTLTVSNPCPGYADLSWGAIASATGYEVLMLKGDSMSPIATTTSTGYLVSDLISNGVYVFAVRALLGGKPGRHSIARAVVPSAGACASAGFNNDFTPDLLVAPVTGRMNTSSQLGTVAPQVRIRNLGQIASSGSFDISYQVNGGAVVTESSTQSIAAAANYSYTFTTPYNFSAPGKYTVKAWVTNPADGAHTNDTLVTVVKHLVNDPITLTLMPFTETFETAANQSYADGTMGFEGLDRADFRSNNLNGRARTFVNTGIARSGNRAITLDQKTPGGTAAADSLILTFNLGAYTTADQMWLSFYYQNQGIDFMLPGNRVWIRGSDNGAWLPVHTLNTSSVYFGSYLKSPAINITETLANAVPAQSVSSSFQIRFGENGYRSTNSVITNGNLDDGYTYDDVTITLATNDVGLTQVTAPVLNNVCALSNTEPITVQVKNYSASTLFNVPVSYSVNGGAAVTENIASLTAGQELNYTFTQPANLGAFQAYTLTTWVDHATDDYSTNDTLVYEFHTSPYITSFPYAEGFETNNGHWYSAGINNSWQWGKPEGTFINKAANGDNAWVTNLNGNYNNNELSYLYSPCFNLTGLTRPVLSFSHIWKTEDNCVCDYHWIDYSTDGVNWYRLDAPTTTNWFDNLVGSVWQAGSNRWQVSSIEIPFRPARIRFRIALYADAALTYEGVGIDDIHLFDGAAIYTGADITSGLSQPVSGNDWIHFEVGGERVASIHPNGQDLGITNVNAYFNTGAVRNDGYQYYLDRNLVIQPTNAPLGPVKVRYYFTHSEANKLITATGCGHCSTIADAYASGVTQYSQAPAEENGTLADNKNGIYQFITPANVLVMPYDNGYYAEYQVTGFSEFWINSGGPGQNSPLPLKLGTFTAVKKDKKGLLQWTTLQEENTESFIVERSNDGTNYTTIGTVAASGHSNELKQYGFVDQQLLNGINFYRLNMKDVDGKATYSPIREIDNNDVGFTVSLRPNPVTKGLIYINTSVNATSLELHDATGRLLKAVAAKGNQHQLPVHKMAKGVYFVTVHTDLGKKVEKVFIE